MGMGGGMGMLKAIPAHLYYVDYVWICMWCRWSVTGRRYHYAKQWSQGRRKRLDWRIGPRPERGTHRPHSAVRYASADLFHLFILLCVKPTRRNIHNEYKNSKPYAVGSSATAGTSHYEVCREKNDPFFSAHDNFVTVREPVERFSYDKFWRQTKEWLKTKEMRVLNKLCGRPPQYAPTPASWPLTFWPWRCCPSHMWRGLPLCQY